MSDRPIGNSSRFQREGWWPNRTLLSYFDVAVQQSPHKTAIVANGGVRLSFREVAASVDIVAGALHQAGLGRGDVLSLQLPNCAEFVILHLAATRLGAVTNPLLPNYRANELRYILAAAHTKIAVVIGRHRGFEFSTMYEEMRASLPELRRVFFIGEDHASTLGRCDALFGAGAALPSLPAITQRGDELSSLIFTSGTESKPKGVMHSHNTMLYGTLQLAQLLSLTSADVIWVPSPVGHGTGFQWGVRQALTLGTTMVLQEHWDPQEALRLIEAERCSFVISATPFVAALTESAASAIHDLTSLRVFGCAGAPIPKQLGAAAEARLGCAVIGMWGMSECFIASASGPQEPPEKRWGTDGCAMPGGELAIFDETRSRTLPPGEIGELATRGPFVSLGYLDDPERTAATFSADGWLYSGDLATMDAEGYIRLVGRMKDVVNRGGLKFSTKEIEDLLLLHPSVLGVAVIPLADAKLGEKACACIVLRGGESLGFNDMINYLEQHQIAKFKLPEQLTVLDHLPITASGKIQKSIIRQRIESGELATAGRS